MKPLVGLVEDRFVGRHANEAERAFAEWAGGRGLAVLVSTATYQDDESGEWSTIDTCDLGIEEFTDDGTLVAFRVSTSPSLLAYPDRWGLLEALLRAGFERFKEERDG